MKKNIELLLVNSYAPRQRSISEASLESELAIIRTYLEKRKIGVEVIDDQRLGLVEEGTPQWCRKLLYRLTKLQLKFFKHKAVAALLFLAAWPLHALALQHRRDYMSRRLEQIVAKVKKERIPFLSIKLWHGDAFSWSRELAMAVRRESPETVIVVIGTLVKIYGEILAADDALDLTIMGQGEEILEKLISLRRTVLLKDEFLAGVDKHFGGRFVATGGYSDDKAELTRQLAAQPIPRYREEDISGKILFHIIADGVGCSWNKCNFCSRSLCKATFTPRPVEDIIAEIDAMVRRGVTFFRFSSSETPVAHGRMIAEAILTRGINIRFSMFVRALKPTAETLEAYRLMIRAGLRAVFMGGETGHDLVNSQIMNKGVERKDIIDTIATIRLAADAASLPCRIGLSLIYPCPLPAGVALEEVYNANMTLIQETVPDTVIVNPPGPFPGTRWFEDADKFGFQFKQGTQTFLQHFMRYEYSLFKPAELWQDMGFALQGMDFKTILKETGRLRAYAASSGIPTDISDEYLMMTEAIGIRSKLDMLRFKQLTLLDIVSGTSGYTREIAAAINAASRELAAANLKAVSFEKAKFKAAGDRADNDRTVAAGSQLAAVNNK